MVKPSDIDTKSHFFGTVWGKSETETIAHNIVVIGQKNGDRFKPFTWVQYQKLCDHDTTAGELRELERLAEDGYLHKKDHVYTVTAEFCHALFRWLSDDAQKGMEPTP